MVCVGSLKNATDSNPDCKSLLPIPKPEWVLQTVRKKNKAKFEMRDCSLLFTNFSDRLFQVEAVPHGLFQDTENKLPLTCSSENPGLSDRVGLISFNFSWVCIRTELVACSSSIVTRKRREMIYPSCFWMGWVNFCLFTLAKENLHDFQ